MLRHWLTRYSEMKTKFLLLKLHQWAQNIKWQWILHSRKKYYFVQVSFEPVVTSFQLPFFFSRVSSLVMFCNLLSIAVFSHACIVIHGLVIFFRIILSYIGLFCEKQISKTYFLPCCSELFIFHPPFIL